MIKQKLNNILNLPARMYNYILLYFKGVRFLGGGELFGRIKVRNKGNIIIGSDTVIYCSPKTNKLGAEIRTYFITENKNASINVGKNVRMSNVVINALDNVTIGNDVMIGGGTVITDSNHHSIIFKNRMMYPDSDIRTSPVIVGDGVFIGMHSMILKGSKIGDRSVIGAGSVVTGNIPPDEIWGGNPARFIKSIEQ